MVKLMHHFGFDERHIFTQRPIPAIARERLSSLLHLSLRAEKPGVVCHVKHSHKPQLPLVAVVVPLVPQDACATIDELVEVRIDTRPKRRTGAGVGIEQREVGRCQREVAILVGEC